MAILEGIQIKNFRALKDVTLGRVLSEKQAALPRLIAVIGANGAGKSSVLDALGFFGDCLREGVEAACDKPHRKGFESLRTRGSKKPIQFELRYRHSDSTPPINYTLHIDANPNGLPYVAKEELQHKPVERATLGIKQGKPMIYLSMKGGKGDAWIGGEQKASNRKKIVLESDQELAISALHALKEHPQISQFRNFLMGWYLSFFDPDQARAIPAAGPQAHLNRTGGNLANYLQYMKRDPKGTGFQRMLNRMVKKIPGIKNIQPDETADKRLLLKFSAEGYEGEKEVFFQHEMSDGTLKMLAYMSLLEDPNPAPLIGIEEPENGLYQSLLLRLVSEFKEATQADFGTQILLTTHSTQLVDGLSPQEVWVLEKNSQGHSALTRAADIKGVQALYDEDIPMGSLWYSNHLGTNVP